MSSCIIRLSAGSTFSDRNISREPIAAFSTTLRDELGPKERKQFYIPPLRNPNHLDNLVDIDLKSEWKIIDNTRCTEFLVRCPGVLILPAVA